MERKHKFSIWYVLLGVWVVLIIQSYIASMFAYQVIPYSQFLGLLQRFARTFVRFFNGSEAEALHPPFHRLALGDRRPIFFLQHHRPAAPDARRPGGRRLADRPGNRGAGPDAARPWSST